MHRSPLSFSGWGGPSLVLQCRVHVDQPPGSGCGAGGVWTGGLGPGGAGHQCCPGGALPYCRGGSGGGSWRHPHQLQRREATHAPQRRFPGWSAGPHICGLQHVKAQQDSHPLMRTARTGPVCDPDRVEQRHSRTNLLPVISCLSGFF